MNGNLRLRQEFDPMWFLSHDSHIVRYIDAKKVYYPNTGFNGFIVGHQVNWTASFASFDKFVQNMKNADAIFLFDTWYEDFKKYSNRNFKTGWFIKCFVSCIYNLICIIALLFL